MNKPETIQGRPLSDRFAPWSGYPIEPGWNFHDAMHELQCLIDGLFQTWEDIDDVHVSNRVLAIYYGARRLCQDISDVYEYELKQARAQGAGEAEAPAADAEEASADDDEPHLNSADLQ